MRISCRDGAIVDIGNGQNGPVWGSPVTKIARGPVTLLFRGALWIDDDPLDETHPNLDALLERGMQALLDRAEGRFWVVLFNSESKLLDLATDPFAGYPLYLVREGGLLHITDDPLEAGAFSSGDIDADTAAMVLTAGYTLCGRTLLKDVSTLGPGQHLTLAPGQAGAVRNYIRAEREAAPGYENAEELVQDIDESLKRIRHTGRRSVVFLSGGVDSRLLASRLLASGSDFEAISWTGQRREPGVMDDHGAGAALAAAAGARHHSWQWSLENFQASADPGIYRSAGLSNNFQVWPQGDGFLEQFSDALMLWGDETFGWGQTTTDLGGVFSQLGFLTFKDERIAAFPDLLSMVLDRHPFPDSPDEASVSKWKQRLYSEERVSSFIMKNQLAVGGFTSSCSPFLSRRIVARFQNTAPDLTNEKSLARRALEISQPSAFAKIPFADHPAFDPPGRSMILWRRLRDVITETLGQRTALSSVVNIKAYLHDLDHDEMAHRLRAANLEPTIQGVDRFLARTLPEELFRKISPGLRAYLRLNVNRPAGDAFPCLYAMQRFLLKVEELKAKRAQSGKPF